MATINARKFYEFCQSTGYSNMLLLTSSNNLKEVRILNMEKIFNSKIIFQLENIGIVIFDFKESSKRVDNNYLFLDPNTVTAILQNKFFNSKIEHLEKRLSSAYQEYLDIQKDLEYEKEHIQSRVDNLNKQLLTSCDIFTHLYKKHLETNIYKKDTHE